MHQCVDEDLECQTIIPDTLREYFTIKTHPSRDLSGMTVPVISDAQDKWKRANRVSSLRHVTSLRGLKV